MKISIQEPVRGPPSALTTEGQSLNSKELTNGLQVHLESSRLPINRQDLLKTSVRDRLPQLFNEGCELVLPLLQSIEIVMMNIGELYSCELGYDFKRRGDRKTTSTDTLAFHFMTRAQSSRPRLVATWARRQYARYCAQVAQAVRCYWYVYLARYGLAGYVRTIKRTV